MSSLNKVMLIGNLGRDPEVRTMPSGGKLASFSIAMTESWRDKNTGERKDRTEWANVVVFNEGLVRVVEQYCKKGGKVYVEGQIKTRDYTDKDGNPRKATEVVIPRVGGGIVLLNSQGGQRGPQSADDYGTTSARQPPAQTGGRAMDLDDDIPF